MLIKYSIGNFMSFNEIQEFSMIAGKVQDKKEHLYKDKEFNLLKFNSFYGANGSGKSNLIKSMSLAQDFIFPKQKFLPNQFNYRDAWHKFIPENIDKPTYFEFYIKVKNRYFTYGFEILLHRNMIVSEWLIELKGKKEEVIFTREFNKRTKSNDWVLCDFSNDKVAAKFEIYRDDIFNDNGILFLTYLNDRKSSFYSLDGKINETTIFIQEVFLWFATKLKIIMPTNDDKNVPNLWYDNNIAKELSSYITSFDTGIKNIKVEKIELENLPKEFDNFEEIKLGLRTHREFLRFAPPNVGDLSVTLPSKTGMINFLMDKDKILEIKKLSLIHNNIPFSLTEESDGTIKTLQILSLLLSGQDNVYIFDEIERSLHPMLTKKIIELFLSQSINNKKQLIIATHESLLLDFKLLRKDEINFIEKDNSGQSTITPLDKFKERKDKKLDKSYFEGRYGGIPIFKNFFIEEKK